jgi:hypothetical protein
MGLILDILHLINNSFYNQLEMLLFTVITYTIDPKHTNYLS